MRKSVKEKEAEMAETVRMNQQASEQEPFDFDSFKLEKLEDFDVYNSHVRKHNRMCVHERNKMKIKVPDESFYKLHKVKFSRFEQRENVLKAITRTKDIEWKGQLKSGGTYMLPMPVINYLNNLAIPEFAEVKVEHGSAVHTETKQVGESPRFACSIIEYTN